MYNILYNYNANGQLTTNYFYDGSNLVAEQRVAESTYTWLYYLYGIDGIAGFRYNNTTYLFRKNIQGDVTHIYTESGTLVGQYAYDAWGNCAILQDTNGIATLNPFRYRGYYFDTEINLYYLQSRYYDPETCRFVNADDISYLDPETIGGLNLYAYCGNNPVMAIDPTGTFALLTSILIGMLIGAVIGGIGGAVYSGYVARNNNETGTELASSILRGFLSGALIGAAIGGIAGALIYAAPAIGSFLGSSFTFGGFALANGGVLAVTVTGVQVVAGATSLLGLILLSQWEPGSWPGDDPTISPGDGFEWRGQKPVGGDKGAWYNPSTHDSLHPDLHHPAGVDPHWDWINKILEIAIRIFRR